MKTLVFGLLAALFGLLSVVGGIGVFLGGLAYGIWTVIVAVQTSTVTFGIVLKAVICLFGSGAAGWITFFILAGIASVCGALAKDS